MKTSRLVCLKTLWPVIYIPILTPSFRISGQFGAPATNSHQVLQAAKTNSVGLLPDRWGWEDIFIFVLPRQTEAQLFWITTVGIALIATDWIWLYKYFHYHLGSFTWNWEQTQIRSEFSQRDRFTNNPFHSILLQASSDARTNNAPAASRWFWPSFCDYTFRSGGINYTAKCGSRLFC